MKIKKIEINSFGKLKNKQLDLKEGINVIYGKNESGKSTLLNFIVDSLYGIAKTKNGKEISDYEKYTPWSGEDFSGNLEYELDNKNKYKIVRDFKKKNPKIYNENMQEISKEFNIDKTKGNEFFYEQTKVDEELFLSTVVVNQNEVKLQPKDQNILIQKLANLVGTGDDNVSYKRAIDRINRRQLEEIGTERSREKPINVLTRNVQNLEQEKQELQKYENEKYNIEENKNKLISEINELENENNLLKEIKIINENENVENEKIKMKEKMQNETDQKTISLKNKIEEIKNNNKNNISEKIGEKIKIKNKINNKLKIIFILLIIINILQFIFIKNNIFKYIFLLTVPAFLIFWIIFIKNKNKIINNLKNEEKINNEKINSEINNINNEIKLLENNNQALKTEINNLKNNFNIKIITEKEKIKNKYLSKIEEDKIEELINLKNINYEIQNFENKINNKKIELHSLDLDKKNIEPKLDNLSKIEEELVNNKEKMSTLRRLEHSMNLAKLVITEAYEKMKNTITPKFTRELSKNIAEITGGKYSHIMLNDENILMAELENGDYAPVSKLSIGTIDQLYLSLRLSMVEDLSSETLPIILDEAFAYYDTERLKNILNYISQKFQNHQIIILTCTNRETEMLNKLKINYKLNEL